MTYVQIEGEEGKRILLIHNPSLFKLKSQKWWLDIKKARMNYLVNNSTQFLYEAIRPWSTQLPFSFIEYFRKSKQEGKRKYLFNCTNFTCSINHAFSRKHKMVTHGYFWIHWVNFQQTLMNKGDWNFRPFSYSLSPCKVG